MQTMVDIAFEFLKTREKANFADIFDVIETNFQLKWQEESENNKVDYEDIQIRKRGELYKLLTVDARFKYEQNNNWSAAYK